MKLMSAAISVAPLEVPGGRGRIPRDSDLEALFEQVAQVRFDAHVREHPAEDELSPSAALGVRYSPGPATPRGGAVL